MNEKRKKIFLTAYSLITSAGVIASGILFILSCIAIYKSGDSPFNREIISRKLSLILVPVIVTAVLIIVGFILDLFMKDEKPEKKTVLSSEKIKELNAKAKTNAEKIRSESSSKAIKTVNLCTIALSTLCTVITIVYLVFFAEFTVENLNSDVISNLLFIAPFVAIALVVNAIAIVYKSNHIRLSVLAHSFLTDTKLLPYLRLVVLAFALVFVTVGIINGGIEDVYQKAVKICTECIGLG